LVSATVLRLPAVYGSRDPNRRFGFVIDRLLVGERTFPCQTGASWRWTHAHVRNVAHACVLAAETAREGFVVFNVGERETPTMRQRVEAMATCLGERVEWEEVEALLDELRVLGTWDNDVVMCSAAIREALGYEELLSREERTRELVEALAATSTVVRA
jgi:nucleoside-diphosphate-sugar epimerase